jgi:isoquinoline 1-oxidoreductase beta subunit
MISIENVSRRGFLKGVVGAGAFVLGVRLMPVDLLASGDVDGVDPAASMNKAPLHPSVYVAIDTDGTAYIVAHRSEMGNGVRTALPRIVADELDADWARVKVVQATGDERNRMCQRKKI